ncbi:hypothetical protein F2Q68_00043988 [Brassica cretica]|uniref:Uncharacterized protein n=1 Tax=Brassica cretica TaxID=69181 RepID=A0A8S9LPY1_BRACR|nr:hypothetical protein F2Q68_00043988 [Brassica cretica]
MHALSAASAATLSCPSTSSAGSPTSSPSRPSAIVPERQGWLSWLTTDRKIREVFDGLNDLSRQIANPNLQVALIPLGAAWVWLLLLDHLKGTERGLSVEATSTLLDDGPRRIWLSVEGSPLVLSGLIWLLVHFTSWLAHLVLPCSSLALLCSSLALPRQTHSGLQCLYSWLHQGVSIRTPGNQNLHADSCVLGIPIHVGSMVYPADRLVVPLEQHEVIFVMDWLSRYYVKLDCGRGRITPEERGQPSTTYYGICPSSGVSLVSALRAIVRALDRFELSISQLNVAALQNFLGVLILSYELGMDLSPDDFEGLWSTRKTSIDYSYRMAPKRHMSIIQGHTSNAKGWFERFFYVRIDGASVEENCLPLFCGKWNFHRGSGMQWRSTDREASPDLYVHRTWTSHTPKLFPIRGRELGPERTRESLSKTETLSQKIFRYPDGTWVSPRVMGGFTPGDGSGTSEAPLPDDFFANLPPGFTTPVSLDEASRREVVVEGSRLINEGMQIFNSTLDGNFREARLSHFKAEEIERKFIRFQNEVAERERRQAESHSRAFIHADRKGRRTIAAELARRAILFDAEFRSFKDAQDYVGDFRECRGSVGTLWKSQNADFSFLSEVAEMSGLMDGCAQAESMVTPIKGRIREPSEPIEVSEDTTKVGADAADESGEVDQPADSFGASISGYLDLDL